MIAKATVTNMLNDRRPCFDAPKVCDVTKITPAVGTERARLTKGLQDLISAGWRSRSNPDDPSYLFVRKVTVSADRKSAEVFACSWDTAVVFEPNDKASGGEIIANDDKTSGDSTFTLVLEANRWLVSEIKLVTGYPTGTNQCPAK